MRKTIAGSIVILLNVAILFTFALSPSAETALADKEGKVLLEKIHDIAGVGCADCHSEDPPAEPVSAASCTKCHAAYPELGDITAHMSPNPHRHHLGSLECDACHHVHYASEDYCFQCHVFDFKVNVQRSR